MQDNSNLLESGSDTTHWHALGTEEVLSRLQAASTGLAANEAAQRLRVHGPNTLPVAKGTPALLRFLHQFHNILIYVLLSCVVITTLMAHYIDAMVILAVVLANAVIGYLQEGKAEQAINSIRQMLAPSAAVLRNGKRLTIAAEQLVPGDIVLLEAGDKVPADLRLLQGYSLQIQEAILTGESVAVEKDTAAVATDAPLGDRSGMAFSGTLVTAGQGSGVVVATGTHTEMGRISGLLANIETLKTPLVLRMEQFARGLTTVILAVVGALLVFSYFSPSMPFDDMFVVAVGIAVSAIPEGLPAVLTITLAIGVQAMARRNAIVRRLPAIETIGAVSVICTDKTGTLTRNEMQVTAIALQSRVLTVTGEGYAPEGKVTGVESTSLHALQGMALCAALCNDAQLHVASGQWHVSGDPMEGALLAFSEKAALAAGQDMQGWDRHNAIPFDARYRYMATLNRHAESGISYIFVKGAPEKLINMCSLQQGPLGYEPCNHDWWHSQTDAFANDGKRVLALACKKVPAGSDALTAADLEQELVLLGLCGLVDPPRAETVAAIAQCRAAGIRVKMITGDHASTAAAIGRQVGLVNSDRVLTGTELDALDDETLGALLPDTDIFARTSPEHKLRLVMLLQARGLNVAMTGDGVNDAPALKRANIGIAMGKKGSEAAKEAADLVLADDNFASIVAAVQEGRTVQDNLQKVISWTLPTNAGEAMTIVVALLLGLTLPITAVQILWVNLVTASTLGMALAFEPTEPGTMQRPPRPADAPIIGPTLVWYICLVAVMFLAGVFGLYYMAIARGESIEYARTVVVNTLVAMELFQLFFFRNLYSSGLTWQSLKGTRMIWLMITAVVGAQFLFTYAPFMQKLFATRALSLPDLLLIIMAGIAVFLLAELDKFLRNKSRKKTPAQ